MFNWRNTILLGAFFVAVGLLYFVVQGDGRTIDLTGVVMLLLAGVSMGFGLAVLVRGSRDV
ncbi:MAG: hypothetical protein LH650_15685 [Chloroflexi bacterium]|nr:hypothetical protein [Chloroflexota bacterium]